MALTQRSFILFPPGLWFYNFSASHFLLAVGCQLRTRCLNSNIWWKLSTCSRSSNISKSHHIHQVNPGHHLYHHCHHPHHHHHHHHRPHHHHLTIIIFIALLDRKSLITIVSLSFLLFQHPSLQSRQFSMPPPPISPWSSRLSAPSAGLCLQLRTFLCRGTGWAFPSATREVTWGN